MTKKLYRRTKNLIIRPLEPKDFKAWREGKLASQAPLNRWDEGQREERLLTRKRFQNVIRHTRKMRKEDRFYDLKLFDRKTGATVGGVALMEVTRAALDIGFKDLRLHRIEAGIEPNNHRSLRLARALKMRREGLKKRAINLRGGWVDLVMYTLTTEDLHIKFRGKIGQKVSRR